MNILGISAFYHDSAACLVRDGAIVAAAQEERFTRLKHDSTFPRHAIDYCLKEAGGAADIVAYYEKPFLKCDRLFSTYLACAPDGLRQFLRAVPVWVKQKIWIKKIIQDELKFAGPIVFPEHHESHAASAFFPSPFEEAAILTIDGVGEWATTSISRGVGNRVGLLAEMRFPHSIGLLYSAFTYYLGFRVNSGEYKVMGLAPYGRPRFRDRILSELIDLKDDGSFHLNVGYFDYMAGLTMTSHRFHALFGGPRRRPESELTQREMDLARSVQDVIEEAMLRMARHAHALTGARNLCLAGGVALNCVGNGRILREGPFDDIWIQPAAGDAGGALGAALLAWHHHQAQPRHVSQNGKDLQRGSFLGPEYDAREFLAREKIAHLELTEKELMTRVAQLLDEGKVIGWFQGRMEFGPRALGNRSILGDARSPTMQETLNLKIKFRESFRPFAPAVLREAVSDWFELDRSSSYMLLVAPVKSSLRIAARGAASEEDFSQRLKLQRSAIPAVTHVDGSARVQTVSAEDNPRFHQLLRAFQERTGCPVLVNTSFNVRGEPPVCTPQDAYRCFMRTDMDYLVLGNFLLEKSAQTAVAREEVTLISNEYEKLDRSPTALRRFGFTVGMALVLLGGFLAWRQREVGWPMLGAGVLVILFTAAVRLQLFHRAWMTGALALGWVMTRLILTAVFVLVVTPLGLLQRLFKKRALDLGFRTGASGYWETRAESRPSRADYEKQF